MIPHSREVNFIFKCGVDTTAPSLFRDGLPNNKLYEEVASTTMHLIRIVFDVVSFKKVV